MHYSSHFPEIHGQVHTLTPQAAFIFFNKFIYLFYFWLRWVFVAVRGLSLVAERGLLLVAVRRLLTEWLLLLRSPGSRRAGFSSCGTWAQ